MFALRANWYTVWHLCFAIDKVSQLETTVISLPSIIFILHKVESKLISLQVVLHFLKDNRANEIGNQ